MRSCEKWREWPGRDSEPESDGERACRPQAVSQGNAGVLQVENTVLDSQSGRESSARGAKLVPRTKRDDAVVRDLSPQEGMTPALGETVEAVEGGCCSKFRALQCEGVRGADADQ